MMIIKTHVQASKIHGLGLFASEFVPKGTIIWKFTPGFDQKFTEEQLIALPPLLQIYMYTYAWKSNKSGLYCLASDNGKYCNHSEEPNVLSEYRDNEDEVISIASKDIQQGEEMLDNYSSFESFQGDDTVFGQIASKYHLTDELDARLKIESN